MTFTLAPPIMPTPRAAAIAAAVLNRLGVVGIKTSQFLSTRYDWLSEPARQQFAAAQAAETSRGVVASVAVVGPTQTLHGIRARKQIIRSRRRQLSTAAKALGAASWIANRLNPPLPSSAAQMIDQFRIAFANQGDTAAEAHLATTAKHHLEDRGINLFVPATTATDPDTLIMDWCPPDPSQHWTTAQALNAITGTFALILVAGIVHCDIHPGNLYLSDNQATLVDFGYGATLTVEERAQFGAFMIAVAEHQPARAWAAVFDGNPTKQFTTCINKYGGLLNHEFNVRAFGADVMRSIMAADRAVPAHFLRPLVALMGLEATLHTQGVRNIDFQAIAAPYCIEAVLRGGLSA